jgi:hypothetical protein
MRIFTPLLSLILLFGIPSSCFGNQFPGLTLDTIKTYENISSKHAEYWVAPDDNLDINFILKNESTIDFSPVGEGLPNTKDIFWCKWQVQNMMQDPSVVKN